MNDDLIQKFGYSEMYEWNEVPDNSTRLGRFVTFSKDNSVKISKAHRDNDYIIGVTTVNATMDSDNPDEWKYKNMCNQYGDLYLRKEKLAVGEKVYDQLNEINYIRTRPWEHFITIDNQYYNKDLKYVKRTNRGEWTRVNILGKCIVFDDGKCNPGEWCTFYKGKIKENYGSAIPATNEDTQKWYVLERLSDTTILILFK